MADITEQTPLAAPRPKSRKGLVAAVAAVALTLGFAAMSAVDRSGFLAFPAPDPVQIRLRANTNYCLGIKDWQVADKRSEVILVRCSSNPAGQEFQVGGSGGEIKYKAPGRTLCVNGKGGGDFTVGSSFQLYSCKDDDKNSEFTYTGNRDLKLSYFNVCMGPPDIYVDGAPIEGMDCGTGATEWNVPGLGPNPPAPRPTSRPQGSLSGCNDYCFEDSDCVSSTCPKCVDYGDGVRKWCQPERQPTRHPTREPTYQPTKQPQGGQSGACNMFGCQRDSDCAWMGGPNKCTKCMPYGDGVRTWCQEPSGPQCNQFCERDSECPSSCPICLKKPGVMQQCVPDDDDEPLPQCDRQCSGNYDCSNPGGKWSTGQPWCGECQNGWCHPNKRYCNEDYDCDRDVSECGPNGYCVGL